MGKPKKPLCTFVTLRGELNKEGDYHGKSLDVWRKYEHG